MLRSATPLFDENILNALLIEYLYDELIPSDFWEPVKVCLTCSQIEQIPNVSIQEECVICTNNHHNFKQLNCCKNNICLDCAIKWFNESVMCPYCKQDLRKII